MNNQVQHVQVKAVLPLEGSFALFLGNEEKTFVIYVDEQVGGAISMFMRGMTKERPLTHDLMASVLMAFGARVERVVINDVNGSVFYARLILAAENELHSRKLIELDARPSDSVAMAVQQNAPIYVADSVWETVEDVSEALKQIEEKDLAQSAMTAAEEMQQQGDQGVDIFGMDDDDGEEDEDLFDDDDDDDDFDDEFDDEEEDFDEDFDGDEDGEFDDEDEDPFDSSDDSEKRR